MSSPEVALVRVGEGGASGLVPTACLKLSPAKSLGQPGAPPRPLESEQGESSGISNMLIAVSRIHASA